MNVFKTHLENICLGGLIIFATFLAAVYAVQGDIFFHTDIARDFLVLENIVETKNITLIGPRTGSISGLFHGPLWFYLNLPAFIVAAGNPSVVAWWWITLMIFTSGSLYYIGQKVISQRAGMIAALLIMCFSITKAPNMFNPYGAVMFSPWFLYFWYEYIQTKNWRYLAAVMLCLGILIQFQMAFGGPLLILTVIGLMYACWKHRQWWHVLIIGVLIIPLSTFLVFDIRHDWLQLRAVQNFIQERDSESVRPLKDVLRERIITATTESVAVVPGIPQYPQLVKFGPLLIWIVVLLGAYKSKEKLRKFYIWATFFYVGYWCLSAFYPGIMWNYYFWPFLPWVALFAGIGITVSLQDKRKWIALPILALLLGTPLYDGILSAQATPNFVGKSTLSWKFYQNMTHDVFNTAGPEFGYYIFTEDLYGNEARYGMNFNEQFFTDKNASPYQKKKQTFLIFAPAVGVKEDFLNGIGWKRDEVRIAKDPIHVTTYSNGYRVEEYDLTEEEIANPSNPLMIQGLN